MGEKPKRKYYYGTDYNVNEITNCLNDLFRNSLSKYKAKYLTVSNAIDINLGRTTYYMVRFPTNKPEVDQTSIVLSAYFYKVITVIELKFGPNEPSEKIAKKIFNGIIAHEL